MGTQRDQQGTQGGGKTGQQQQGTEKGMAGSKPGQAGQQHSEDETGGKRKGTQQSQR